MIPARRAKAWLHPLPPPPPPPPPPLNIPKMAYAMDHAHNTYLAVTLAPSASPLSLVSVHPALTHVGQVGQLADVQLYGVPKTEWERVGNDILGKLSEKYGVLRVDVQEPKQRVKRGGDEL